MVQAIENSAKSLESGAISYESKFQLSHLITVNLGKYLNLPGPQFTHV